MMTLKTVPTRKSVSAFIKRIDDPVRRADCQALVEMMSELVGEKPKMWGEAMVGFGRYHYKYASGHEGSYFITGFSPRNRDLTIYVMQGFKAYADLMERLGKHRHSASCLYIKRLDEIDREILKRILTGSIAYIRETYPG